MKISDENDKVVIKERPENKVEVKPPNKDKTKLELGSPPSILEQLNILDIRKLIIIAVWSLLIVYMIGPFGTFVFITLTSIVSLLRKSSPETIKALNETISSLAAHIKNWFNGQ